MSELDKAVNFLALHLADDDKPATEMDAAAKAAGISIATLRRAKQQIGVKSYRKPARHDRPSAWYWTLSDADCVQHFERLTTRNEQTIKAKRHWWQLLTA